MPASASEDTCGLQTCHPEVSQDDDGHSDDDQDDFRNVINDQSIIFPLPQELQYLSKVNNSASSVSSFYSSSSEDEPISPKSLAPIQLSVIKKIVKTPVKEPPADTSGDSGDSDAGKGRGQGQGDTGKRKVILGQR